MSASKQEIVAAAHADTSWMELAIARSYQSALDDTPATQSFDCSGGSNDISKGETLYEATQMCPVGYYTVDGVPVITGYYEWAEDMQLHGWQVESQALAVVARTLLATTTRTTRPSWRPVIM